MKKKGCIIFLNVTYREDSKLTKLSVKHWITELLDDQVEDPMFFDIEKITVE